MRVLPHLGWAISGNGKGQQLPERSSPCSDSSKTEEWGGITEAQLKTLPSLNRELCFSWDELLCSPNGLSEDGWCDSPSCRRAGGRYAASSAPKDANTDRVKPGQTLFQKSVSKIRIKGPYLYLGAYKRLQSAGGKYVYIPVPSYNCPSVSRAFPKSVVMEWNLPSDSAWPGPVANWNVTRSFIQVFKATDEPVSLKPLRCLKINMD